jgi:hypothetical protein
MILSALAEMEQNPDHSMPSILYGPWMERTSDGNEVTAKRRHVHMEVYLELDSSS